MLLSRLFKPMLLPAIIAMASNSQAFEVSKKSDRMIVKYAAPMAISAITTDLSLTSAPTAAYSFSTSDGAQVVQLDDMTDVSELESLAEEIKNEPGVLYAEPDYIMTTQAMPDDSYYGEQWHYFEATGGINLEAAWDITTGSSDVVVAVIDTGVLAHEDLKNNLLPGYDFISSSSMSNDGDGRDSDASDSGDAMTAGECGSNYPPQNQSSSWHGTHVAGTIAAESNNSLGVAGVSWNSKILPVRVLGKCGGYTSDITDGIRWAAGLTVWGAPTNTTPAKVINLSLGGYGNCSNAYQSAIDDAVAAGTTIMVAAGNDNDNARNYTPASCDNVVTVAATNRSGGRAYYSNYGSVVDVAAPGGETTRSTNGILSTLNSGSDSPVSDSYDYYQGTSMATPHVAGVAALMYSVNPNLTPAQVKNILESTARSFPSTNTRQCTTSNCGAGIIDAEAAVIAAGGSSGEQSNALENGVAKTLSGNRGNNQYFTVEVPESASNLVFTTSGGSGDADLYVRYGSKPTDSVFDCRPWQQGNDETCEVSVQAGTWHVMVQGYSDFSSVNLVAKWDDGSTQPPAPEQSEFVNNNSTNIPDSYRYGIDSAVDVNRSGEAGVVEVSVNISHSFRGDIAIKLTGPDGSYATLKSKNSRDSSDNVNEVYSVNFGSRPAAGTWTLNVSDNYSQDTGVLNSWSLKFN